VPGITLIKEEREEGRKIREESRNYLGTRPSVDEEGGPGMPSKGEENKQMSDRQFF